MERKFQGLLPAQQIKDGDIFLWKGEEYKAISDAVPIDSQQEIYKVYTKSIRVFLFKDEMIHAKGKRG